MIIRQHYRLLLMVGLARTEASSAAPLLNLEYPTFSWPLGRRPSGVVFPSVRTRLRTYGHFFGSRLECRCPHETAAQPLVSFQDDVSEACERRAAGSR